MNYKSRKRQTVSSSSKRRGNVKLNVGYESLGPRRFVQNPKVSPSRCLDRVCLSAYVLLLPQTLTESPYPKKFTEDVLIRDFIV